MLLCYNIHVIKKRKEMIEMKYLVHYWVEGFGGQKRYFETYEEAEKHANKVSGYAEDIEIIKLYKEFENTIIKGIKK